VSREGNVEELDTRGIAPPAFICMRCKAEVGVGPAEPFHFLRMCIVCRNRTMIEQCD